ncbi:hypothetical protein L1887_28454 [Cichorium endivia]|nr:hypothetical protein L1887_28454 [Cichorium endivia]
MFRIIVIHRENEAIIQHNGSVICINLQSWPTLPVTPATTRDGQHFECQINYHTWENDKKPDAVSIEEAEL